MKSPSAHPRQKLILFTLAALQFSHVMDFMIMMPLGPQLMRVLNFGPREFSFLVSSYNLSAGIASLIVSVFIDRFPKKKSLLFFFVFFLIGTALCALAPSYSFLLAARMFAGFFGGVLGGLSLSVVSDLVPYQNRGRAVGVVSTGFSAASVFGVPLGLYFANLFSWHIPFLLIVFFGLFILALVIKVIPPIPLPAISTRKNSTLSLFTRPSPQVSLLLTVFVMLGQFSIIPFLSPYMVANVGFKESQLFYIYVIGGGISIFTLPWYGKLADTYGKQKIFTLATLCVFVPILILTNLPPVPIYVALVVTAMFFFVSGGRMIPSQALVSQVVPAEQRGSFLVVNSAVQSFASALAALIAGQIISRDALGHLVNFPYVGLFAICMGLCAIAIIHKVKVVL